MNRQSMAQVILPAVAAAVVVLGIGALLAIGDKSSPTMIKDEKTGAMILSASSEGMSSEIPSVDAKEWKPGPGHMEIWDVVVGEGDPCKHNANITIHYTGWTKDGNSFDSSLKTGQPATFDLGNLIRGWQEGIPGMKPGGIRRLKIPYIWAYGEKGSPPNIPPKADLVFEVKLIKAK